MIKNQIKLLTVMFFLISFLSFSVNAVQDNLYISIGVDDTECVEIKLPNDSGSVGAGKYGITVNTDMSVNYRNYLTTLGPIGSITKKICFTPKSNSFSSGDKVDYTITVSSVEYGTSNVFSGKVCVGSGTDDNCAALFEQVQQICAPGEKRCSGNNVEQCNSEGNTWLTVQTCDIDCSNNGICDTEQVNNGNNQNNSLLYTVVIIAGVLVIVLLLVVYMIKNTKKIKRY